MRFKKIGRLRARAGIGQEVLQTSWILRPPRPGLPAIAKETPVVIDVGLDALLDIRNYDADDRSRGEDAAKFGEKWFDVAGKEEMFEQMRNKDITHASGGERQAPTQ